MSKEKPRTKPIRLLIVDRPEGFRAYLGDVDEHLDLDVNAVQTVAEAKQVLAINSETPFDWVVVRKNLSATLGDLETKRKDAGFDLLRSLSAGEFGDYSGSRFGLITFAMEDAVNASWGENYRAESVDRLYGNAKEFSNVDYVHRNDTYQYLDEVSKNMSAQKWDLPNLHPQTEISNSSIDTQSVETNASNISR